MDEFPFTETEWQAVRKVTHALTNATLMDDDVLRAVWLQRLHRVLGRLHRRYGDHPVLFETWADFLHDPPRQRKLYHRALRISLANQLPTWTIRVSYARLLLEEFGNRKRAVAELQACEEEVLRLAEPFDRDEWRELLNAALAAK